MSTASLSTTLCYGVGILGIGLLSFTSFGMKRFFGIVWPFGSKRRGNDNVARLEQTIAQKDNEITQLRKTLSAAETHTAKTERELADARKEVEHVNGKQMDLEKRTREALGEKEALERVLEEREGELEKSREETRRAQDALEHTKSLLEVRTSELKLTEEAFLSKSDRYAGADIMKMIETLNSEIHQTASIMADMFSPDLQQPRPTTASSSSSQSGQSVGVLHEAAAVHTEEILGENMTKMLQAFNHREENILLQIAFQASMCAYTEWIMDSWCYHDRDAEVEMVLQETYEQLRETEEQPVSAKWRILTRKYVRQLYPAIDPPSLAYHIFAACANILIISGLQHESEQQVLDTLVERFSERLALIVQRSIHLNNVIGDDVTSCEFVPIYCTPDIAFDPSTMESASSDIGGGIGQHEAIYMEKENRILCTTDLGLLRAEKVMGEDGTWHNTILLKPKVVMASSLTASPTSTESSDWSTHSSSSGTES